MAQEDENPSKKRQDLHRYDAAREDVSDYIHITKHYTTQANIYTTKQ